MGNTIELHRGKRRVSILVDHIAIIQECRHGTTIHTKRKDNLGFYFYFHCIESYDEVMALINKSK